MKNILNNNDLNVDEISSDSIETANIRVNNILIQKTSLKYINQNTQYTFTVSDVFGRHIVRRITSLSASLSENFPDASAFVNAGLKKGDEITCIVDIWNDNSGFTYNLGTPASGVFKTNSIGTNTNTFQTNIYRFIITNDTPGSEEYWLYRTLTTNLNNTRPISY